jgi:hypothetical protein
MITVGITGTIFGLLRVVPPVGVLAIILMLAYGLTHLLVGWGKTRNLGIAQLGPVLCFWITIGFLLLLMFAGMLLNDD